MLTSSPSATTLNSRKLECDILGSQSQLMRWWPRCRDHPASAPAVPSCPMGSSARVRRQLRGRGNAATTSGARIADNAVTRANGSPCGPSSCACTRAAPSAVHRQPLWITSRHTRATRPYSGAGPTCNPSASPATTATSSGRSARHEGAERGRTHHRQP